MTIRNTMHRNSKTDRDDVSTSSAQRKTFDIDKHWPAIPGGSWPEGFTVSRTQIYDESGRLTGGPQEDTGEDS